MDDSTGNVLSVFKKQGRPAGKWKDVKGFTTTKDFNLAKATVLLNCGELTDLVRYYKLLIILQLISQTYVILSITFNYQTASSTKNIPMVNSVYNLRTGL